MRISSIKQSGFTLIEMVVSLALFTVVAVTAVGSLLAVISANQQLQAEQSVMTNLSFALDSMTREMRTGYAYVCGDVNNSNSSVISTDPTKIFDISSTDHTVANMDESYTNDCTSNTKNYRGVSFIEGGESITGSGGGRILYYFVNDSSSSDYQKLMRRVEDSDPQSITSSGLEITDAKFIVTGSETLSDGGTDTEQPTITIYIEAESDTTPGKTYYLETTVTQRILDI